MASKEKYSSLRSVYRTRSGFRIKKPVGKFRLIGAADVQFLAVVALVSGEEQEGSFTRMIGAWSEW